MAGLDPIHGTPNGLSADEFVEMANSFSPNSERAAQLIAAIRAKSPVPIKEDDEGYNAYYTGAPHKDGTPKYIQLSGPIRHNPYVMGHEIGHAIAAEGSGPSAWSQKPIPRVGSQLLGSAMMYGSPFLENRWHRALVGLGGAGVKTAPILLAERAATGNGRKVLEGAGATPDELKNYDELMHRAYGTYMDSVPEALWKVLKLNLLGETIRAVDDAPSVHDHVTPDPVSRREPFQHSSHSSKYDTWKSPSHRSPLEDPWDGLDNPARQYGFNLKNRGIR